MKISGFSFVRNGLSLYYPVVESICSILPIVDEFVIAVGAGDPEDRTREAIEGIGDPRIRIIDTVWSERDFRRGAVNAVQTDIARSFCSGDWLFYLQADEVVHERFLPVIRERCEELLDRADVEGLLFRFRHFWGDYDHYVDSHAMYREEIRIVRNHPKIRSWHSAQSFRYYEHYEHPWQESGTRKLNVARVDAEVYHYGWVRPPRLMQEKNKALNRVHAGPETAEANYAKLPREFEYGNVSKLPRFHGTHPKVMESRIAEMNWQHHLVVSTVPAAGRLPKHERLRYRILTFLEQRLLRGRRLFSNVNYRIVDA